MVENKQGTAERQHGTGKPGRTRRIIPRFTIGVRIISFVVLVALLAGGIVGLVTINTSRYSLRQTIFNHNLGQADMAAEFASKYVKAIQINVLSFATDTRIVQAILDNEPEGVTGQLTEFVQIQTALDTTSIYDTYGIQRATSDVNATTVGQSFADREWFQQAVATLQTYQGVPVKSRVTGKAVFPYSIPILDENGQLRGVLTAGISLAVLSDAIVNIQYGSDSRASIMDSRNGGLIIAHSDPQRILTQVSGKNEAAMRVLAGERGAMETISSSGELDLVGFAPVPDLPWGVMVITPSKTALAIVQTLTQNAIIFTGLIILFAAILGGVFVLQITRPVNRLVAGTIEIGRGNLDYKVATKRRDEIGDLSRAFGDMTEKLKSTMVSRDKLVEEVTERKRLEQERDKFTEELKEKNAELERFTYTVSHDLKSPLVTVKTFLGYLQQDITSSDTGRIEQDMLYMNGAADKMGKLLEELLEMSRIGRMVNPAVSVTFQELVQETLNLVAGRIEERGVKVQVSDEPITLYGDRPRLVEIWQNLVENAVKFMGDQPSPRIDIGVEQRGSETVFFVRDNGIGIDPQYQPRIFNLFEKLNPRSEGTGMGLAITKRIVELYKGKIWAESQGTGEGTCFRFTLPAALIDKGKGGQS